jgi:hypothetical protein
MTQFIFAFSEADCASILRRYPKLGDNGLALFSSRDQATPFPPAKATHPILIWGAL